MEKVSNAIKKIYKIINVQSEIREISMECNLKEHNYYFNDIKSIIKICYHKVSACKGVENFSTLAILLNYFSFKQQFAESNL